MHPLRAALSGKGDLRQGLLEKPHPRRFVRCSHRGRYAAMTFRVYSFRTQGLTLCFLLPGKCYDDLGPAHRFFPGSSILSARRNRNTERGGSKFSSIMMLLVLAVMAFAAFKIVPAYFADYQLHDAMVTEARFAIVNRYRRATKSFTK